MATLTQIGAVIGFKGAKEYQQQLKALTAQTREFATETAALTATFEKGAKSMSQTNQQRDSLKANIEALNNTIRFQEEELAKVNDKFKENQGLLPKEQEAYATLSAEINENKEQLAKLTQEMDNLPADNFVGKLQLIKDNLEQNDSKLKEWGESFEKMGDRLTKGLTLPIAAGATASVKFATDWESAMNGVRKTTNMSDEELRQLGDDIQEMALHTTYSSVELANLAQIAGQLGVRGEQDLTKFISVVSDLGISTDLAAEDAATALARIFNITEGGNLDNLERVGSVIVHLGNNMATTEPEIVAMANRMASAASVAGLTTDEIFALSSALSSVGITAEAGGSTIGQVLTKIDLEFANFSQGAESNLERIAEISGMSATEFADTWQNEPVRAFEAFVTGLGNLNDETDNINIILDELSMAGIRESNMLKAMAQAQEEGTDTTQLFTHALELTKEAYNGVNADGEEFNALLQEANVRKEESATKFANLIEAVRQLGVAFGEQLLPMIIPIIEGLTNMIYSFSQMDESTKNFIITMLGIAAALGPALVAIGQGMQLFSAFSVVAKTLDMTNVALLLSMGKWVAIGALVVGAVALIIKAIQWVKEHSEDLMRAWEAIKDGFALIWEFLVFLWELGSKEIMEWFSKLGQKLKSDAQQIGTWVKNAFTNMKDQAVLQARGLYGKVKEVFSNMVSNALSWGKDLMGNLISGITSKISSLVNSISNVASTIWSYLHFSEPEKGALKNFNSWMPDMMSQMAQGINDNLYLIDRAADNVANSLGMGANYNYGGVVINLNVPQGANGYQLVDEIENALAQRTVRRRAVFG